MVVQILMFCLFLAGLWFLVDKLTDWMVETFPGKKLREAQKEYDETVALNKKLEKEIASIEAAMKDTQPEDTIRFLQYLDSTLNERGITNE